MARSSGVFMADTGGHCLRCSLTPGVGSPLLMLNGIGGNIEMWKPLATALGDRPTLAVDLPGTGRSSTPMLPLGIGQLAEVISGLLDHLEIESLDVLGYSFGGSVAQSLARREPVRVRRLTLAASTAGWGGFSSTPEAMAELATPARYLGLTSPESTARAFGDPSTEHFTNLARARMARPPSPLGYTYQLLAAMGFSSHSWLHEIAQETLVISGELDRAIPLPNAELLAQRIPRARLEIVANAGHLMLMQDDPSEMAALIEGFFGSTDRQGSGRSQLTA